MAKRRRRAELVPFTDEYTTLIPELTLFEPESGLPEPIGYIHFSRPKMGRKVPKVGTKKRKHKARGKR